MGQLRWKELSQVLPTLDQGELAGLERAFVGAVFDLYTCGAVVSDVRQGREELAPVHVAKTGQLRPMELQRICEYTHAIELPAKQLRVLYVDVEDAILEFVDRLDVVHELPDEM